ncbi:MAG: GIY-YIG nuclease family protein [Ilumatobacteraceae bacterium]
MVTRPPAGTIPDTPGSYQFKDVQGRVIYVGKASSLRQRLSNYFQDPRNLHPRTAQMVATATSVEWIEVRNEVEALMLEYSLIKQHRPRFNVRLRDDKSYPFLAVTLDEQYPRALVMRGRKRKGTRYFGPYLRPAPIRETLDLLLRSFPSAPAARASSTSTSGSAGRACCTTSRSAAARASARSTRCRTASSCTSCASSSTATPTTSSAGSGRHACRGRRARVRAGRPPAYDRLVSVQRAIEKQRVAERNEDLDVIGIADDELGRRCRCSSCARAGWWDARGSSSTRWRSSPPAAWSTASSRRCTATNRPPVCRSRCWSRR